MLEPWVIVAAISLAFSIPVLLSSYYTMILFISSLRYPGFLQDLSSSIESFPLVSVLIASYNEKFVIGRTLDAIKSLDYPAGKLLVIVADDSTDETGSLIDKKLEELNSSGISGLVSRRTNREGFKSAALNHAAPLLRGEYVLLLDADSTVTPGTLSRGLGAFRLDPGIAFVSFRVGHYNREQNVITRLFAISLDQGDTVVKMGSYALNAPFSFQGGFTLISLAVLRQVGFWTNDSIVDDADLSCRIYAAGWRGIYLSNVKVFGEDPPSLEVWKKQTARVAQGWTKCARSNFRKILGSIHLTPWRRIALLLFLLGPFSALSWIVVTFVSAIGLVLGFSAPANSIFTSPAYVAIVTLPLAAFFLSGAYALHVQKIMTPKNLLLLPLLSYASSSMTTAICIGFLQGIRGRTGFFFRTPKSGVESGEISRQYFRDVQHDRIAIAEAVLAILAIGISVIVLLEGVWVLFLSLAGFGVLTLKSMNLSRSLRASSEKKGD
ncbi:MAG TPA: glycosyltransferase family 2 protein [Candidatus Bathyarchaeia archaeon]|nr:glycosyltransferase family 2 protein [Candidatus Bathyarchaeia archaeon]